MPENHVTQRAKTRDQCAALDFADKLYDRLLIANVDSIDATPEERRVFENRLFLREGSSDVIAIRRDRWTRDPDKITFFGDLFGPAEAEDVIGCWCLVPECRPNGEVTGYVFWALTDGLIIPKTTTRESIADCHAALVGLNLRDTLLLAGYWKLGLATIGSIDAGMRRFDRPEVPQMDCTSVPPPFGPISSSSDTLPMYVDQIGPNGGGKTTYTQDIDTTLFMSSAKNDPY